MEFSFWSFVANRLKWFTIGHSSIQSATPSGRHKTHGVKVKHLPWLILYRSISEGALEVRHAIKLTVLLALDQCSPQFLLRDLFRCSRRCVSGTCHYLRRCRIIGRSRLSWKLSRFRRRSSSRARCSRSAPVISPSLSLIALSPIPLIPMGLPSRGARVVIS